MFVRARSSLGVTWRAIQFCGPRPNSHQYATRQDAEGGGDPGQEELYVPLAGSAILHLDGEQHRLEPGVWARVGVAQLRRIVPGDGGFQYLAIGGVPGEAFAPPAWTELGAAPPSGQA